MDCDCNTSMQFVKTEDEFVWVDNETPQFSIYENYECSSCGSKEKIDVTGSYICENPFQ